MLAGGARAAWARGLRRERPPAPIRPRRPRGAGPWRARPERPPLLPAAPSPAARVSRPPRAPAAAHSAPRGAALTHLSFSVPKMEAKYSAISHSRGRRHRCRRRRPCRRPRETSPDATTLSPPRREGADQSGEALPERGRDAARARALPCRTRAPARPLLATFARARLGGSYAEGLRRRVSPSPLVPLPAGPPTSPAPPPLPGGIRCPPRGPAAGRPAACSEPGGCFLDPLVPSPLWWRIPLLPLASPVPPVTGHLLVTWFPARPPCRVG